MAQHTKIFVNNLPEGSRPEDLRGIFEVFGTVTECTVKNRWGFVHMQTEEQATAAIGGLNHTTFNGGMITVEKGNIKERVGPRGGGRDGPRRGKRGPVMQSMRGGYPSFDPYRGVRGRGRFMRGPPMTRGMSMRSRGYNRGMRGHNPGFNYGIPDSRGFTLMEIPEPFVDSEPLDSDNEQTYAVDDLTGMQTFNSPVPRPPMFYANRGAPMGNSHLYKRRGQSTMRGRGFPSGY